MTWKTLRLLRSGLTASAMAISMAAFGGGIADTWTVVHGGMGTLVLNADGTYYSSCVTLPTFPGAVCPAPQGTYTFGANTYVTFTGSDGSMVSYRLAGDATAPTTMTLIDRYYDGMIIDRGGEFKCSEFFDNTYYYSLGPLGVMCGTNEVCALGSGQLMGPRNADTHVFLAETSPGYLVVGHCPSTNTTTPTSLHVADLDGTSAYRTNKSWTASVTITVVDNLGSRVANARIHGYWTGGYQNEFYCTTDGAGTCVAPSGAIANRYTSEKLNVADIAHPSLKYSQPSNTDPDGDSNGTLITVRIP